MAKRADKTFHLTFDSLAALRSKGQFSRLPESDQNMLEEYLQTAFCGANRLDGKLMRLRLTKALMCLGLCDGSELWTQLEREIENAMSVDKISPKIGE